MKMRHRFLQVILALVVLTSDGCHPNGPAYTYRVPEQINDGLTTAGLREAGMDSMKITRVVDRIRRGKYGEVHSLLVYKDENLILEEYFPGHAYQWDAPDHKGAWVEWDRNTPHVLQSASKSFVSICFGIAVDKGFIDNIDQSIFDYLPEFKSYNRDNKEYVTIRHLLTMTSGFQWDEWNVSLSSKNNDAIGMHFADMGAAAFVLQRPLVAVPGTHFTYSGGDMQILAAILRNATGLNIDEFSDKYVFKPMGITSNDWWLTYHTGEISGAGGLKLTPRDMLKIGVLYLNDGEWKGNQIVPAEWVEISGVPFKENTDIRIPGEDLGTVGYGYTWWTKNYDEFGQMFCALGWGGQKILVFSDQKAVVVFTGANFTSRVRQNRILENYLLPAMR